MVVFRVYGHLHAAAPRTHEAHDLRTVQLQVRRHIPYTLPMHGSAPTSAFRSHVVQSLQQYPDIHSLGDGCVLLHVARGGGQQAVKQQRLALLVRRQVRQTTVQLPLQQRV